MLIDIFLLVHSDFMLLNAVLAFSILDFHCDLTIHLNCDKGLEKSQYVKFTKQFFYS